jgi:hypothetical protein
MPSMTGLTRPGICVCGGPVYAIADGEVLPREYRITPGRLAGAASLSAAAWFAFFCVAAMAVAAPPEQEPDREENHALAGKALAFTLLLGLCGAILGLAIPIGGALQAAQRGDVNGPHPAGVMPAGQAALLLRALGFGVCMGLLTVWQLAPLLAPEALGLRADALRVILGAGLGLFAGFLSYLALFKVCRS